MGRPSKLTPERAKRIIDALAVGNTRTCAVAYAGIWFQTFLDWLARGETEKAGRYHDFYEAVKKAEADAEFANVIIIRKAAIINWQAAAWWLERRRHQDWMKREHTELSGPGGAPVQVENLTPDQAAKKVADLIRDAMKAKGSVE